MRRSVSACTYASLMFLLAKIIKQKLLHLVLLSNFQYLRFSLKFTYIFHNDLKGMISCDMFHLVVMFI